ncbi:MAG: protein-ADP-ribose hydrolase [Clostridia bacterium]|nr:protein-ADP-ribose hydrolase [Clostridia bacterium]
MNHSEQRIYLIKALLAENKDYKGIAIPREEEKQKVLLRSLMNVREPAPLSEEYLDVEKTYLRDETAAKGVTRLSDLVPASKGIYLWQGDITTLECDAIVNAANSALLGCFRPMHNCIDNCIHTYAGLQLRNACAKLMDEQGFEEPPGRAKITPAFNLPCRYVIHTVGPIVTGTLTGEHKELLASCYTSCLKAATDNNLKSIAFCCISTGVFGFPQKPAAEIAVKTVKDYRAGTGNKIEVIFNVFKDEDYKIYRELLGER